MAGTTWRGWIKPDDERYKNPYGIVVGFGSRNGSKQSSQPPKSASPAQKPVKPAPEKKRPRGSR